MSLFPTGAPSDCKPRKPDYVLMRGPAKAEPYRYGDRSRKILWYEQRSVLFLDWTSQSDQDFT